MKREISSPRRSMNSVKSSFTGVEKKNSLTILSPTNLKSKFKSSNFGIRKSTLEEKTHKLIEETDKIKNVNKKDIINCPTTFETNSDNNETDKNKGNEKKNGMYYL